MRISCILLKEINDEQWTAVVRALQCPLQTYCDNSDQYVRRTILVRRTRKCLLVQCSLFRSHKFDTQDAQEAYISW